MTATGIGQIILYAVVLVGLCYPLGAYMARVYTGKATFAQGVLGPVERLLYRIFGVKPDQEQTWKQYAIAVMVFNGLGIVIVYLLQRLQAHLPANPNGLPNVDPRVAFNTAVSFGTNTNWQTYGGESTMSHLVQSAALGVQNFVSAATGMAVLIPLVRGFVRKHAETVGSFWVDLTRSTLYILMPLAVVMTVVLVHQGVPQTMDGKEIAALLDPAGASPRPAGQAAGAPTPGGSASRIDARPGTPPADARPSTVVPPVIDPSRDATRGGVNGPALPVQRARESPLVINQPIAVGPVASQVAIKQLGTNGGGYYNVNSAHPLENPTPMSNFVECIAILLIAGALCFTFGRMVGSRKQGVALLVTMAILLVPFVALTLQQEQEPNPAFTSMSVDSQASVLQPGGNMEGKEARFGISASALWATTTTAASNGSVNSMHDSYSPLGGLSPMFLMALGEVSFGGVGSGLYGLLIFAIVAVFIAGLMVGRTPEFLGKKIEAYEMKMASWAILVPVAAVLLGAAFACLSDETYTKALSNHGPHGFSEVLYAFISQGNNNGSAFGGLTASGTFFATAGGICMWVARYWIIIPTLAIAGSLAKKKLVPPSSGTLPTTGPLFVVLLVGVVVLVGALSFVPALALGPIVEHLVLHP